jgi:HEAT repeat protein
VRKALRDKDVAALKTFAADANPRISAEALFCLQQLDKGDAAAAVIRERLNNADPQIKASALMALGLLKQPDDVVAIAAATTDGDANVRRAACAGLGSTGSPEAIEPLAKVLEKESEESVWSTALASLKQVTGVTYQVKAGVADARRTAANQYRAQIPLARSLYQKSKGLPK